jgi:hypothetical protein
VQEEKRKKLFVLGGVAGALLFGALTLYLLLRPDRVAVEIFVTPSDSQVTMDGKPIKAGNAEIPKGKHTFVASRQYFESTTTNIDTDDLSEQYNTIYVYLYPNSPEGEQWLTDHPTEQNRYERIDGEELSKQTEAMITKYPIVNKLPYSTTGYKIDYSIAEDNTITYLVQLYPVAVTPGTDLYKQQLIGYRSAALNWLKKQGIDTSKAAVKFTPDPSNM